MKFGFLFSLSGVLLSAYLLLTNLTLAYFLIGLLMVITGLLFEALTLLETKEKLKFTVKVPKIRDGLVSTRKALYWRHGLRENEGNERLQQLGIALQVRCTSCNTIFNTLDSFIDDKNRAYCATCAT